MKFKNSLKHLKSRAAASGLNKNPHTIVDGIHNKLWKPYQPCQALNYNSINQNSGTENGRKLHEISHSSATIDQDMKYYSCLDAYHKAVLLEEECRVGNSKSQKQQKQACKDLKELTHKLAGFDGKRKEHEKRKGDLNESSSKRSTKVTKPKPNQTQSRETKPKFKTITSETIEKPSFKPFQDSKPNGVNQNSSKKKITKIKTIKIDKSKKDMKKKDDEDDKHSKDDKQQDNGDPSPLFARSLITLNTPTPDRKRRQNINQQKFSQKSQPTQKSKNLIAWELVKSLSHAKKNCFQGDDHSCLRLKKLKAELKEFYEE